MLKYSREVKVQGLQMPMMMVLQQAGDFSLLKKNELIVVTSAVDGMHMENSLHYAGAAVDLCVANNHQEHQALADYLARNLTPDFQVIDELDHVHVEYQPQRP